MLVDCIKSIKIVLVNCKSARASGGDSGFTWNEPEFGEKRPKINGNAERDDDDDGVHIDV